MAYPSSTDYPTSLDSAETRTDGVDTVFDDDFNYPDIQVRRLQQFLGQSGELIGQRIASTGLSGMLSPSASGGTAFQFAARNNFTSGKLFSVGDDYDNVYSEKVYIDYDGAISIPAGFLDELLIPNGSAANPAVDFASDPGNGLYLYGADQVGITAAGTARAYFSVNGLTFVTLGSTYGDIQLTIRTGANPSGPTEAQFWYDGDDDRLKYQDGAATQSVANLNDVAGALPDDDQVLWVDASSGAGAPDGSIKLPFATIGAAITAANGLSPGSSNRITIQIRPGVYDEALTTQDDYVDLVGMDKHTTVISQSSGSSAVLTLANDNVRFSGITFESASTHTGRVVTGSTALTDTIEFQDCDFLTVAANTTGGIYFSTPMQADLVFRECNITHGDTSQTVFSNGSSNQGSLVMFDCVTAGVVSLITLAFDPVRMYSCLFSSGGVAGSIYVAGSGVKEFLGCTFYNSNVNGAGVYNNAVASGLVFTGCNFYGGSSSYDIESASDVTCKIEGCHMTRGMSAYIRPLDTAWYIGGNGDKPFFQTLNAAMYSLDIGDYKHIILCEDVTITSTLFDLPGGSADVVIDGQGLYTLSYAAGRIVSTGASNKLTFRDIDLEGEIRFYGNGTELVLDNVHLSGSILNGGVDASSYCLVRNSTIVGNSTYYYPIQIFWSATTGHITVENSYLKGYTGSTYAAVYWQSTGSDVVDWDGLALFRSQIYNGQMSTNDPFGFGIAFSSTVIDYIGQYCTFNALPEDANPGDVQNSVPLAAQFNAETTVADTIGRRPF